MNNDDLMLFFMGFGIITLVFGALVVMVYILNKPKTPIHQISDKYSRKEITFYENKNDEYVCPSLKDRLIKR